MARGQAQPVLTYCALVLSTRMNNNLAMSHLIKENSSGDEVVIYFRLGILKFDKIFYILFLQSEKSHVRASAGHMWHYVTSVPVCYMGPSPCIMLESITHSLLIGSEGMKYLMRSQVMMKRAPKSTRGLSS